MRLLILAGATLLMAWQPPVAAQQRKDVDLKEWSVEWGGRTRDPAVAPDGKVWFVGQEGNYIAHFDPKSEQFKRYEIEEGRTRTASTWTRRASSGTRATGTGGSAGSIRAAVG